MTTKIIRWTEFHNYEAEVEIPDILEGLEEELNWVMSNTNDWDLEWREPYQINIDWDSFEIDEE